MTLRLLALAAVGALAASQMLAPKVLANVFAADGRDPRRIQPRSGDGQAFAAIGIVRNNSPIAMLDDDDHLLYARGEATAFMVSPCLAVTNYHAVFGEDSGPTRGDIDHSVTLSIGDRPGGRGFKTQVRAVPAYWGAFDEDHEGQDWTVLRLDRCVGADEAVGWLDLDGGGAGGGLSIAGYPGDKDQAVLWRADNCRVSKRPGDADLWSSDCAASPGASGSPVFATRGGVITVVGIMEGAEDDQDGVQRRYEPTSANLVVDVNSILQRADVRAAIDADIKALQN